MSVLHPAMADIRIELEGVDGDVRRNVLALLSLERYKDRDRIEPDAVQRLYRRVDDEVRSAMRPVRLLRAGHQRQRSAAPTSDRHWHVKITDRAGRRRC
jgi:hypothetical protein